MPQHLRHIGPSSPALTRTAWTALALACAAPAAWAQNTDPLQVRAGFSQSSNSNLFLLPASANPQLVVGSSDASDVTNTSTLGATLHTQQSLQTFDLDMSVVNAQYQKFSYLGYTGANYNGGWSWAFTPHLTGHLTSTRQENLNSFTDTSSFGLRNKRVDTSSNLDADYELGASWHLIAGVLTTRETNEQALLAGGDFTNNGTNTGVRYDPGTGSTLSYTLRSLTGNYFNQTPTSPSGIDSNYTELDQVFEANWSGGDGHNVIVQLIPFTRTQPNDPARNFSGVNSSVTYNWVATGKTSLSAAYQHNLGSYITATSNYSSTDSVTLGPIWQISAKTFLKLQGQWTQTDYQQLAALATGPDRIDNTRDTVLSLTWTPTDRLTISTSLEDTSRSSNIANVDYQSTIISLNATFTY